MSRRKLTWFISIISLMLVGGGWLMTDESLDAQTKVALDITISPITDNNGFIYLLGWDANADEDPYTLGKTRLLQQRQWLQYPAVTTAPTIPRIPTFRAPLWFDGSDEQLCAYAKDLPYIIASNATLYSRYQTFLQFTEFNTLTHLNADVTDTLSQSLQIGNRFLRADVLSKALTGASTTAAALIVDDMNGWRHQLQQADSFAQKLLAARLLTDDFSLIVTLTQKNAWSPEAVTLLERSLEPFSLQEISLERALLHAEFSKLGYGLLEAKTKPTLIHAAPYNKWQLALLYKPNMSINFLYREYLNIANENNLPPRQLFHMIKEKQLHQLSVPLHEWIKNSVGVAAVQELLGINFLPYTANLWDVDVNRMLTKLILEARMEGIDNKATLDAFIQAPRFHGVWENQPPHYKFNDEQLCYNGPVEDKKGLRCIDISWLLHKTP